MGKLLAISLLTTMTAAAFFQPMLMGKPREKELHQHERLKRRGGNVGLGSVYFRTKRAPAPDRVRWNACVPRSRWGASAPGGAAAGTRGQAKGHCPRPCGRGQLRRFNKPQPGEGARRRTAAKRIMPSPLAGEGTSTLQQTAAG